MITKIVSTFPLFIGVISRSTLRRLGMGAGRAFEEYTSWPVDGAAANSARTLPRKIGGTAGLRWRQENPRLELGLLARVHGASVGLASGIYRCGHAAGLVVDHILAALHKLFPLGASAIRDIPPAVHIVTHLFFALVHKSAHLLLALLHKGAHLFLALVHQRADLLGRQLGLCLQIFGALACAVGDILAGFLAALGSIENAHQGPDPQSRQEPRQSVAFAFVGHDAISPFAQLEEWPERIKFTRCAANAFSFPELAARFRLPGRPYLSSTSRLDALRQAGVAKRGQEKDDGD